MSKITLSTVSSFQNDVSSVAAFNANMATLQAAIDYLLSRDGTSPNQMTADLDMNGKKIINLPTGSTSTEPVTQDQLSALVISNTSGSITNGSIVEAHFSNGAVSTRAIADNAVTGAKILDGTVTSAELANNSVTTVKIPDANVTFAKLPTIANQTVVGNNSGATGAPATITFSALATALGPLIGVTGVPIGTISSFAGSRVQTGYLLADGSAVSRTTYSSLYAWMCPTITQTSTATFTVASNLVNWSGHTFSNWDRVVFSTTGALPTGVSIGNGVTGTTYYVRDVVAGVSFKLATTVGGTAVAMSGTPTGNTTILGFGFGLGDGSTTFTLPDLRGEFIRGLDLGRGIDVNRNLGSAQGHQFEDHTHGIAVGTSTTLNGTYAVTVCTPGSQNTGIPNSGTHGAETRPRNVALVYGIKT